jgi:hypothetical protein
MTTAPEGSASTGPDARAESAQDQAAAATSAEVPASSTDLDADADWSSDQTVAAGDEAPAEG